MEIAMPKLTKPRLTFNRLALLSAACAALLAPTVSFSIEILNKQGAKEIAENAKLPGSVPTGWRVYQQRCASCHGPAAEGTTKAPDLLPRVREMGSERFSNLVLKRYDWSPTSPAAASSPQPAGQAVMPAWQSNAVVNAHIVDLYAYLSARAEGSQGPGQPAP
jgi:mono/diheme cytochrome c family protein